MQKINKRRKTYQTVLFLVVLSILMSALPFSVGANTEVYYSAEVSSERFLSDEIRTKNANITVNGDGKVTVSFENEAPSLSMNVNQPEKKSSVNAVRVVLKNNSNCETLDLEYSYKNSAQISETARAQASILPYSEAAEYILYTPNIGTATSLTLTFSGTDSGDAEIWSVGVLSYYHDNREYFGELTKNTYNTTTKKAKFSGTVSYETVLANQGASIVLYRLDQTEIIEDVRFVHPYVASTPMSLTYSFDFSIESPSDYCSRYFAAVLTLDNKIIPLTSETYLKEENADNALGEAAESIGFKGIETNLYSGALENGTSVAFVDIYLDRLGNADGIGYQYILDDGKEYYFDRSYVLELDAEMDSFASSGAAVYFRFLLDSASPLFGDSTSESAEYFAIDPKNDDIVDNIFAYTDFICSRYADAGALKGVVLGRALDKSYQYNYCNAKSMNDYADMLAKTYSIIRIALDRSGSGLEVLMPVSDDKTGVDVVITDEMRDKDYPADILASSLLSALKRYGSDVSSMYFMLENDTSPTLSEGVYAEDSVSAADCGDFINMIKKLSEQHPELSDEIVFCWYPSAEMSAYDLISTYIFNYNVLSCTEGVRSYVVSLFEAKDRKGTDEAPAFSEKDIFLILSSTYKYADTYHNSSVSDIVLEDMGVDSWSEIVDGYKAEKAVKRTLIENSLTYAYPITAIGNYKMWDFSTANGAGGWSKANGCTRIVVNAPHDEISRVLSVTFDTESVNRLGAKYGSIVYYAPESLLMSDVSAVSFDATVVGEGELYEIRITVGADDGTVLESTGTVKAGERTTTYADISVLNRVQYIKIGIRSLDGAGDSEIEMRVGSISIYSEKYDSDELEKMVLSGEMIDSNSSGTEKKFRSIAVVGTVILASILLVSAIWTVISLGYRRSKH